MGRRKLVWIGIPIVVLALLAFFATQEAHDSAFGFLEKLHPIAGPLKPAGLAGLAIVNHAPSAAAPHQQVFVFPGDRAAEIDSLISERFPTSRSRVSSSYSAVVNGAVTTNSSEVLMRADRNGHEITIVTGEYVASYLPLLRTANVPPNSCLVLTSTPATGTEKAIDHLLRFLHLR